MVKTITTFVTEDGKSFDSERAAMQHEEKQLGKAEINYRKFINNSYSARGLLEQYSLSTYGLWEVLGEDDNADFGGYHHQPSLGVFEGTLDQAIRKAVSIPRFYSWGAGGSIRPVHPPEKL